MPAEFFYFPFDAGPGSDSLENRWEAMMMFMRTNGVLIEWDQSSLDPSVDDLAVTANGGLSVQVAVGEAWIRGFMFQQQDDYYSVSISPNASGLDRIDLLSARLNTTNNIIEYYVEEGTPAAMPVAPTPVASDPVWDLALAEIYVANGAVTILSGDITDVRVISTQGGGGSSAVTLSNAGGDETLVADSNAPPALVSKGLTAGTGISLSSDADSVTITNTGTAASTSSYAYVYKNATTTGLTDASTTTITFDTAILNPSGLWENVTNPERITVDADAIYYLHARVGWVGVAMANGPVEIQIVLNGTTTIGRSRLIEVGTDTIYLNAQLYYDLAEDDYLELDVINDSGQTLSLTSGADGPSLQVLKLTATNALGVTLASGAGDESLVKDGAGPDLETKALTAGTNVSLSSDSEAVTINADTVTLASAGGSETLVADGTGPDLETKGLTAGAGITLNAGASSIEIVNSSAGSDVTLASGTGDESLVKDGVGPDLETKALTGGTSISLTADSEAITITNDSPATSVTLTSAGGTETLVNDGTGPAIATKGLTAGNKIDLTGSSTDVTIDFDEVVPTALMERTATYSMGTGTGYNVDLDTEIANNAAMWTVGTPNSIFIQEDGIYLLQGSVKMQTHASSTGTLNFVIYYSVGGAQLVSTTERALTSGSQWMNASTTRPFSTSEYVYLRITNSSGQTLNVERVIFNVTKIGEVS